jgi:hypothetical protein
MPLPLPFRPRESVLQRLHLTALHLLSHLRVCK